MSLPDFSIEQKLYDKNYGFVAGVDEVGRGCIAGPVVAAAVILNGNDIPIGINDSKKLSCKKREILYQEIMSKAQAVSISTINAAKIDEINILQASLLAMYKSILILALQPDYVIIDGRDKIEQLSCAQTSVIKGDQQSVTIAAASIIAKVTRDRIMHVLAKFHPQYGFERHVGYATKQHKEAIKTYGPLPKIHRYSFAPLK